MLILAIIVAVLGMACLILAVLYIKAEREARSRRTVAWDLKTVKEQRDKLNTRNAELFAQNADLREALQEAMAENKALQMQTIEVAHAPMTYAEAQPIIEKAAQTTPAKRPARTKKAGQA